MAASKSKSKETPLPIGKAGKFKPVPRTVYAPKSTTLENRYTTVNVTPSNQQHVSFNVPKFTPQQLGIAAMFMAAGVTIGIHGGLGFLRALADLFGWMFA